MFYYREKAITCIIDNQAFPREKLCAGVLTTKAVNLMQHVYKGIDMDLLDIKYMEETDQEPLRRLGKWPHQHWEKAIGIQDLSSDNVRSEVVEQTYFLIGVIS